MRKFIEAALGAGLVAATLATPMVAGAQSAREIRQDQREIRQGQREIRRDIRRGDYEEAREDRRELREDRRELREDWRDYRRSHQQVFRRGPYAAPRGYAYRPVRIGTRIAAPFRASRYWVSDPRAYRLPAPGAHRRWIRYGNDVLLVDVRSGAVISLYGGFFL